MKDYIKFEQSIEPAFADDYDRLTLINKNHIEAIFIRPYIEDKNLNKFAVVIKTISGSKYTVKELFDTNKDAEKYIENL